MALHRPGQSRLVVEATQRQVRTKNGAVTKSTTCNNVLDLFFIAGASRTMSKKDILNMFIKAYGEDKNLTLKCIFHARDVRGGAGERRFFRICWNYLLTTYPEQVKHLVKHVPEYGRWDDIFFNEEVAKYAINQITTGLSQGNGLLAKWLPRKGPMANYLRYKLRLSPKEYRQRIVALSSTVEQQMCENKWQHIKYPHVPSVAMNKYRKAFYRNDLSRYSSYIEAVIEGRQKINAEALFPHTLVRAMYSGDNPDAIQAQWDNLPNFMEGSTERILPISDTSGSMSLNGGLAMDVSLALGVYISERNEGIFKNAFMTFSAKPEMHIVSGSLKNRLRQIKTANAGYNTNLIATFSLLLNTAVRNRIRENEMPTKVLIISDMEFDGTNAYQGHLQRKSMQDYMTNYETIKKSYKAAGYRMPELIFWNVNGRKDNVPATSLDQVGLVSGFSPSILKSILAGKLHSPVQLMLDTIDTTRYHVIRAKTATHKRSSYNM
jgi:hypothetical protein